MPLQIRKAARQKAKLRVGLSGPSGSGKTYSALLIAKGLCGGSLEKTCVIDTEDGSADLYSHLGAYSVIRLEAPFTPEIYIEAINACEKDGMEAIIIDSSSHEWDGKGGCCEINQILADTKFKGNTWAAWSQTTTRHRRFLEAITTSKMHVITATRSKTDTIQTEDKKIKKVGLKEIQREGFEYELTINFTLDREKHYASTSKDRTGIFIELDPFVISEETGKILKEWSESGVAPIDEKPSMVEQEKAEAEKKIKAKKNRIMQQLGMLGFVTMDATRETITAKIKEWTSLELNDENLEEITARLHIMLEEQKEAGRGGAIKPSTTSAVVSAAA